MNTRKKLSEVIPTVTSDDLTHSDGSLIDSPQNNHAKPVNTESELDNHGDDHEISFRVIGLSSPQLNERASARQIAAPNPGSSYFEHVTSERIERDAE